MFENRLGEDHVHRCKLDDVGAEPGYHIFDGCILNVRIANRAANPSNSVPIERQTKPVFRQDMGRKVMRIYTRLDLRKLVSVRDRSPLFEQLYKFPVGGKAGLWLTSARPEGGSSDSHLPSSLHQHHLRVWCNSKSLRVHFATPLIDGSYPRGPKRNPLESRP